MDALNTTFDDESFAVAIDKATIDALIPSDKQEYVTDANKYFREISRLLKNGGRYICISLLQEHVLNLITQFFPNNNFMVRVVRCFEAESKDNRNGSLPIFIVICTKFKALPNTVSKCVLKIPIHVLLERCCCMFSLILEIQKILLFLHRFYNFFVLRENFINTSSRQL